MLQMPRPGLRRDEGNQMVDFGVFSKPRRIDHDR